MQKFSKFILKMFICLCLFGFISCANGNGEPPVDDTTPTNEPDSTPAKEPAKKAPSYEGKYIIFGYGDTILEDDFDGLFYPTFFYLDGKFSYEFYDDDVYDVYLDSECTDKVSLLPLYYVKNVAGKETTVDSIDFEADIYIYEDTTSDPVVHYATLDDISDYLSEGVSLKEKIKGTTINFKDYYARKDSLVMFSYDGTDYGSYRSWLEEIDTTLEEMSEWKFTSLDITDNYKEQKTTLYYDNEVYGTADAIWTYNGKKIYVEYAEGDPSTF